MGNEQDESKKVMLGLLIGGAIGAGLYCYMRSATRKTPILQKVGRSIAEMGEMIENCDLEGCSHDIAHKFQSHIPSGKDLLNTAIDWASSGMSLWNKIKKGR